MHKDILPKTCSIGGCRNKHEAKGLCSRHYGLLRRKEHPESWSKYYLMNKEKIKKHNRDYGKFYYLKHKEERIKYWKIYRNKNKDKINKYFADRRKVDMNFRLSCTLRSRLSIAVRKTFKNGSAVQNLGCTMVEFRKYLESKFEPGMSWSNYGHGNGKWGIDHFFPISLFNLEDDKQLSRACHFSNLRPMWHNENIKKSNKIYL